MSGRGVPVARYLAKVKEAGSIPACRSNFCPKNVHVFVSKTESHGWAGPTTGCNPGVPRTRYGFDSLTLHHAGFV